MAAKPAEMPGQGHSVGALRWLSAVGQWNFRQGNKATEPCYHLDLQNSLPVVLRVWLEYFICKLRDIAAELLFLSVTDPQVRHMGGPGEGPGSPLQQSEIDPTCK